MVNQLPFFSVFLTEEIISQLLLRLLHSTATLSSRAPLPWKNQQIIGCHKQSQRSSKISKFLSMYLFSMAIDSIQKKYGWLTWQCWTVGEIFTFGRSGMFGHDKLQPSAVGCSRSRRIKKHKTCHKSFDQQSFQINRWILQESH